MRPCSSQSWAAAMARQRGLVRSTYYYLFHWPELGRAAQTDTTDPLSPRANNLTDQQIILVCMTGRSDWYFSYSVARQVSK